MLVSGARPSSFSDCAGNRCTAADGDDGVGAGRDDEAVRPGRARAVEQGVDGDVLGVGLRPIDPELLEGGNSSGVDSAVSIARAAGGQAVDRLGAEETGEIAGPLKAPREFVPRLVQRIEDAKAAEASMSSGRSPGLWFCPW